MKPLATSLDAKLGAKLAAKLDPRKHGFSPMMTAIVGAILGHDYGVRDRKGGKLGHLSITSDGFVIAASSAHESGAFLCAAEDMLRNLSVLRVEAGLSNEEYALFNSLYKRNVTDWRIGNHISGYRIGD